MKKVLLAIFMVFSIVTSACSCNKFSITTYESAVKNFKESTGFEFELTIITETKNSSTYQKQEYKNAYMVTTSGKISNFSSELKEYVISTPSSTSPSGTYTLTSVLNRYYVGEENCFYWKSKEREKPESRKKEYISYEEKYSDVNSQYNVENLVPLFKREDVSSFSISKDENKKGYSIATFKAEVPHFIENSEKITTYSVTMNKDFYFNSLRFTVINGDKTITYEYKFGNYNSKVSVEFPSDLINY